MKIFLHGVAQDWDGVVDPVSTVRYRYEDFAEFPSNLRAEIPNENGAVYIRALNEEGDGNTNLSRWNNIVPGDISITHGRNQALFYGKISGKLHAKDFNDIIPKNEFDRLYKKRGLKDRRADKQYGLVYFLTNIQPLSFSKWLMMEAAGHSVHYSGQGFTYRDEYEDADAFQRLMSLLNDRSLDGKEPLARRLFEIVKQQPGLTDREITNIIFGSSAAPQRVNGELRFLSHKGNIIRQEGSEDGLIRNFARTYTEDEEPKKPRNPSWTRDELILALELYIDLRGKLPDQTDERVIELSNELRTLSLSENANSGTFRNPNGVAMKLGNFRRFDPLQIAEGKTGLSRGGKLEEQIWNEFANDIPFLKATTSAIRSFLVKGNLPDLPGEDEGELEASEGRLLARVHLYRERDHKISKKKKDKVFKQTGHLKCEGCNFDFFERYGERGFQFIECHHTKPLSLYDGEMTTKEEDLALVCANCHRIIHRGKPWLGIEELKAILVK